MVTHRCEAVYLDVGTNIGVQIRKLFEPQKYPGAPVHSVFAETFASTDRCKVCAIGVEPNSRHRKRLSQLQFRLSAAGAGVHILLAPRVDDRSRTRHERGSVAFRSLSCASL